MRIITVLLLTLATVIFVDAQWVKQDVKTTASFRGLSVVNKNVVWASGTGGTVIRTLDGGKKWDVFVVPGAEKLDFRDIEAFDAKSAFILSIGNGASSRIYKTTDGGKTWDLQFKNDDQKAFFDAIACWDREKCLAMSDPVEGHYLLLSTSNGGTSWTKVNNNGKGPAAADGEAAFAASGTCLIAVGRQDAYLISGGNGAHVFHSADRGRSWKAAETPIVKGTPGSGIFSIAMLGTGRGIIVGGNYEKPAVTANNGAMTTDGGLTWREMSGLTGYRSGVAYADGRTIIAVGTNGTDVSNDSGKTWKKIGSEDLNAVAAKGKNSVWAVGSRGGVYRFK
jgi:photosystem II stability/assembly factor-like uncharacterized protein